MSRPLKGRIARVCENHRSSVGRAYHAFCSPYIAHFTGHVPPPVAAALKELFRVNADLDLLAADYARARARRRMTEARRIQRQRNGERRNSARYYAILERAIAEQPVGWSRG